MLTRGVVVLTHDYSKAVMKNFYGDDIGEGAETIIGNNVFVGMNSVILMGSHIGNNVIIGAGSIVHGTIPDNVVVAGNPARVICTLEEHYEKRKQRTSTEAIKCAQRYYAAKRIAPTPYDMRYFKSLYTKKQDNKSGLQIWDDFEEFIKEAGIQ